MQKTKHIAIALLVTFAALFLSKPAQAAAMPQAGMQAPGFTLPDQAGDKISLKQFRGKWVVLYFYLKDLTPGCSIEAHNFQRDLDKYKAENAVILGISVDSAASHKIFAEKDGLHFDLLADTTHAVSEEYGSLMTFMGHVMSERNTFLIDPKGVIRKVYVKVNPITHSGNVLADLAKLEK